MGGAAGSQHGREYASERPRALWYRAWAGAGGINVGVVKFGMYDTVMRLIWGGAPTRFPKLKWSMVEGGIGWIASVLQFMDHWWDDHHGLDAAEAAGDAQLLFPSPVLRDLRG